MVITPASVGGKPAGQDTPQPAADMPHQRLRQFGDADDDIGGGHQFADQEEKRNHHPRFGVDAVDQRWVHQMLVRPEQIMDRQHARLRRHGRGIGGGADYEIDVADANFLEHLPLLPQLPTGELVDRHRTVAEFLQLGVEQIGGGRGYGEKRQQAAANVAKRICFMVRSVPSDVLFGR